MRPIACPGATPGIGRRLLAMGYDACLALALLVTFTLLLILARRGEPIGAGSTWFPVSLVIVLFAFFGWFWTHGGQTLGMRAWRLQLVRSDGQPVGWLDAFKRYLLSWALLTPAGLGLWWALVDPQRQALHDRLSRTRLILRPKTTGCETRRKP